MLGGGYRSKAEEPPDKPSNLTSRFYSVVGAASSQTKNKPSEMQGHPLCWQSREREEAEAGGGPTARGTWSQARTSSPESELQDRVRDAAEGGSCSAANGASSQTEAGSLESELQTLRGSLHPLASEFLRAQETVVRIAAQLLTDHQPPRSSPPARRFSFMEANQQLRKQLSDQELLVSHLRETIQQLERRQESQADHRLEENRLLQRELQDQKENVSRLQTEKQKVQEKLKDQESLVSDLLGRNQELHRELTKKEGQVAHLLHENEWLRQEKARLERSPASQKWTSSWFSSAPALAAFPVQVWTTGQTGGCERDIVNDVSKFLAGLGISLRQEDYEEKSDRFLLLFCPIFSRLGSDTLSALEALNRVRKAVLVVLHHKPKGSAQEIVDTQRQVQHEALVRTVHACYSLQDGFYPCEMNEAAVASVAKAIKEQREN